MRTCFYILTLIGLLPLYTPAETAEANAFIAFKGTSTLHGFEGTVVSTPFTIKFTENAADSNVQVSATAALKVDDMTTEHKKRDKNMFKMLDQKNFNLISGSLTDALFPMSGSGTVKLPLKIRNVEQEIEAVVSDWKREEKKVSCHMTFTVSLKAFDLKPPAVLGMIRVGDAVTIECDIEGICK